jgi:hypothetical protein
MALDDSSDESAAGLVDRGIPFARGVRHSPGGGLLCFIVLIELVDTQEGGSEWLGKRRSPAGGFVRGTRFVVQSLCGLGLVGLGAVEPQCAVASRCKNIVR